MSEKKYLKIGEDWLSVIFGLILLAVFTLMPPSVVLPARWASLADLSSQFSASLTGYVGSFILVLIITLIYALISRVVRVQSSFPHLYLYGF